VPLPIQIGSVTQALQRAFGFKGRYTPMLDEIIVPVYIITDPSPAGPTRLCSGTVEAGALIDTPTMQILNPAGSGVIVNVTTLTVSALEKQPIFIAFDDSILDDLIDRNFFRDRRIGGIPAAQLRKTDEQVAPVANITAVLEVDGALSQTASWVADASDPRQPLAVLGPGQAVSVQGGIVAPSNIRMNVRWIEIPITEQAPPGGLP